MKLFLLPLAGDRYELYCEASHQLVVDSSGATPGFVARLSHRFHVVLDRVERDYRRPPAPPPPGAGRVRRMVARGRRMLVRWLAERVAEQRVLWRLRGARTTTALYPADLDEQAARDVIRAFLRQQAQRHGVWFVIYGVGLVASGVLMPIPGPNVLAYYFAFLVVGHFLSRRGAQDGLERVEWQLEPSAALIGLRQVSRLMPSERGERLQQIAAHLGLEHLAAFVERVAVPAP